MNYQILKLEFRNSVHFGNGGLGKSRNVLGADTVFSALCHEAVRAGQGTLDVLVSAVQENRLRLSDALPFIGEELYIPKPLLTVRSRRKGDSGEKKAWKKLEYIPVQKLDSFLEGALDAKHEGEFFHHHFGSYAMVEKASVPDGTDARPFGISVFTFGRESGLYLCLGYEEEDDYYLVCDLLDALSYQGLGGKLSAGYGSFELKYWKVNASSDALIRYLTTEDVSRHITIAASLPDDTELETAIEGAEYRMIRRGGFIQSTSYSDTFRKKRDVFLMTAGSSFSVRFQGVLLDVSTGGRHPVYRYAKPMFLGVQEWNTI